MLYIHKSAGKPLWAMEYSRDEALRKYWDEATPPYHKEGDGPRHGAKEGPGAYYHNRDAFSREDVVRWYDYWHERPGTGARVNGGGVNIIFADSDTHYRGAQNYRRSGEVDAARVLKDAIFAHQVMWDGWVDVEVVDKEGNQCPTALNPVHFTLAGPGRRSGAGGLRRTMIGRIIIFCRRICRCSAG